MLLFSSNSNSPNNDSQGWNASTFTQVLCMFVQGVLSQTTLLQHQNLQYNTFILDTQSSHTVVLGRNGFMNLVCFVITCLLPPDSRSSLKTPNEGESIRLMPATSDWDRLTTEKERAVFFKISVPCYDWVGHCSISSLPLVSLVSLQRQCTSSLYVLWWQACGYSLSIALWCSRSPPMVWSSEVCNLPQPQLHHPNSFLRVRKWARTQLGIRRKRTYTCPV